MIGRYCHHDQIQNPFFFGGRKIMLVCFCLHVCFCFCFCVLFKCAFMLVCFGACVSSCNWISVCICIFVCMNMCLSEWSSLVSVEYKFHWPNELFESGWVVLNNGTIYKLFKEESRWSVEAMCSVQQGIWMSNDLMNFLSVAEITAAPPVAEKFDFSLQLMQVMTL